jgi:TPP-dependent pyruvate/acetoin dehydrogenase alpha subunit
MAFSGGDLGSLADPLQHRAALDLRNEKTEVLLDDYRAMRLIRRAEEAVADMSRASEFRAPTHLAIGQEAPAVGMARHLRPADRSYGAHRSHSHYLALGGDLNQLFAEIMGRETGCSKGMGGSMHLYAPEAGFGGSVPIVAGTVPIAVGAALAFKTQGTDNVAVAFFGDGACEEGVVHESLNMAAVMALPVIFLVENNLFSSHLDIELRQPSNRVARFAEAHRVATRVVDGNDVVAMAAAAGELVSRARHGEGPGFIEAVTYRWRGHVGPNEDIDVGLQRKAEDVAAWKHRDPIARLAESLQSSRGVTAQVLAAIDAEIDSLVAQAQAFGRAGGFPEEAALLDRVYAKGVRA